MSARNSEHDRNFRISLSSGYCDVKMHAQTSAFGGPPVHRVGTDTVSTLMFSENFQRVEEHGIIEETIDRAPLSTHAHYSLVREPVRPAQDQREKAFRDHLGWLQRLPALRFPPTLSPLSPLLTTTFSGRQSTRLISSITRLWRQPYEWN